MHRTGEGLECKNLYRRATVLGITRRDVIGPRRQKLPGAELLRVT